MENHLNESRHLILHFDVNKTILMSDLASGKSTSDTLNAILSECTWGYIRKDAPIDINERKPSDWILYSKVPSTLKPIHEDKTINLITFGSYLEQYSTINRDVRKSLKANYTLKGNIGEIFRPYLDTIILNMTPNNDIINKNKEKNYEFLSETTYHLLPSFFHLMIKLDELNAHFSIVFRTFGIDIPEIAKEYNIFCEGKHPLFPCRVMDGSDGRIDRRLIIPKYSGVMHRTSDDAISGISLAHIGENNSVVVTKSSVNVVQTINNWIKRGGPTCTVAIQDDYDWWAKCNESETSGKLFLVDSAKKILNEGDIEYIEIFFDDNIERDYAHIVDVRDSKTFLPIPFEICNKKYLRRAEPYDIINDIEYFIKEIHDVLKNYY